MERTLWVFSVLPFNVAMHGQSCQCPLHIYAVLQRVPIPLNGDRARHVAQRVPL